MGLCSSHLRWNHVMDGGLYLFMSLSKHPRQGHFTKYETNQHASEERKMFQEVVFNCIPESSMFYFPRWWLNFLKLVSQTRVSTTQ